MNITALEQYVERRNFWAGRSQTPLLTLLSSTDRQTIARCIDGDLSPENLTCDGELSRTEVNGRFTELTLVAQQLRALDPAVKFYEWA
jgi:hypothetical protein